VFLFRNKKICGKGNGLQGPLEKEIFARKRSLEKVKVADKEMKKKGRKKYKCFLIPESGQRQ